MITKETYTKIFLKHANISLSEAAIKEYTPVWWQNTRIKDEGGLRLTNEGFEFIQETLGLTVFEVPFPRDFKITTQVVIFLDKFIGAAPLATRRCVRVFTDHDPWTTPLRVVPPPRTRDGERMCERLDRIERFIHTTRARDGRHRAGSSRTETDDRATRHRIDSNLSRRRWTRPRRAQDARCVDWMSCPSRHPRRVVTRPIPPLTAWNIPCRGASNRVESNRMDDG